MSSDLNAMDSDMAWEEMENGQAWLMASGNLGDTIGEMDNDNNGNDGVCGRTISAMHRDDSSCVMDNDKF